MSEKKYVETAREHEQQAASLMLFVQSRQEVSHYAEMLVRLNHAAEQVKSGGIQSATQWCQQHPTPQVLIVDIDGDTVPLQSLSELAAVCHPDSAIVVMGSQQDVNLCRTLLRHGAFDYLLKPFAFDLLSDVFKRALARDDYEAQQTRVRSGRTIAVTGAQGGVGCSSLVAALSRQLSEQMKMRCAVVDYDRVNAAQALLLGGEGDAGLAAALFSEHIDSRFLQRAMNQVNERLFLLGQEAEFEPDYAFERDHLLMTGASLCRMFNQVIWDLPAARPYGALDVLRHAQMRILVTELTVTGARNTYRLMQAIGNESDGQQLLLVANAAHADAAQVIARDQFEAFIERKLDVVLPHAGDVLSQSLLNGPLECSPQSEWTQALERLTALAVGHNPQSQQAVMTPWTQRWRQWLKLGRQAA
ncbi:hypothetical protein BFW38_00525 [Terasakiispira papahanaumokuakeensis]|uniref:Response regulatory domain-containing protein n=1 Tax=Terasakiispira papahanaumokuakeensis TaxID=197479 RepID=A0A1E2V5W3_9GAMM|nr:response regulator [Terasakiispira papahanaumokuakeensis]ODC02252.1 hypothetical protein BFW38_00525 [Terasakiispira papahanaumokuakeensis]